MRTVSYVLTILCICFSVSAFAQDTTSTDTTQMHKCPMMGAAMGVMPKVVANLQDGSILVISGFKLFKYDSDLKLIQQVTIPKDTSSMHDMQRMCPEMGGRGPSK